MSRRTIHWAGLAAALCLLATTIRCNYSKPETYEPIESMPPVSSLPGQPRAASAKAEAGNIGRRRDDETRKALLDSAMTLIQRAALHPGGDNFKLAVQKLNQYFEGTSESEYALDSAAREYLKTQLPAAVVESFSSRNWSDKHDTRHIEDCMMYYPIAKRVAGTGENLARVRRVFQWVVEQIQLVPPGSLAFEGLPQAVARPYDVLVRGMATEAQGVWAERVLAVHRALPPARDRRGADHLQSQPVARAADFRDMDWTSSWKPGCAECGSGRSRRWPGSARRSSTTRRISSTPGWDSKSRGRTAREWPRSTTRLPTSRFWNG